MAKISLKIICIFIVCIVSTVSQAQTSQTKSISNFHKTPLSPHLMEERLLIDMYGEEYEFSIPELDSLTIELESEKEIKEQAKFVDISENSSIIMERIDGNYKVCQLIEYCNDIKGGPIKKVPQGTLACIEQAEDDPSFRFKISIFYPDGSIYSKANNSKQLKLVRFKMKSSNKEYNYSIMDSKFTSIILGETENHKQGLIFVKYQYR